MASAARIIILGGPQVVAEAGARQARARQAQLDALALVAEKVLGRVLRQLSGPALKVRSGALRRSFLTRVESTEPPRALVGTSKIYARIHEFGGVTRPHLIVPRRATIIGRQPGSRVTGVAAVPKRLLVFFWPKLGRVVALPRVNHPGSNIPERPYLRPALAASRVDLRDILRSKVGAALRATEGAGG